jgi:hypothetical protein
MAVANQEEEETLVTDPPLIRSSWLERPSKLSDEALDPDRIHRVTQTVTPTYLCVYAPYIYNYLYEILWDPV